MATIRRRPRAESSANNWWERSPNSDSSNNFCNVNSDGSANNNNASNTNGLAPFGCISTQAHASTLGESTGGIDKDAGARDLGAGAPKGVPPRPGGLHVKGCKGGTVSMADVFSLGNLVEAGRACCSGVRWKESTQRFESDLLLWAARTQDELLSGRYRSKGFNEFTIHERGKVRRIQAVHISERMVQKCLVRNCLRPLVLPKLISDTYATLPGKGTQAAINRLKAHLHGHYRRHGREGCAVVMDYRDFFGCIDHAALKAMYARLPMDDALQRLTAYFIDCFGGGRGLGLGSEVSQISAVYYLSPIDHWAKDELAVKGYGRYMDDSYALFADEAQAEAFLAEAAEHSAALGLVFNPKVTRQYALTCGFRYLKRRIMLTETGRVVVRPTRSAATQARKRVRDNVRRVADGTMTPQSEVASYVSTMAYLSDMAAHRTACGVERLRRTLT